jgi:hypothetical protein
MLASSRGGRLQVHPFNKVPGQPATAGLQPVVVRACKKGLVMTASMRARHWCWTFDDALVRDSGLTWVPMHNDAGADWRRRRQYAGKCSHGAVQKMRGIGRRPDLLRVAIRRTSYFRLSFNFL